MEIPINIFLRNCSFQRFFVYAFFFQTKRVLCNKINIYPAFSVLWHPVSMMRMVWIQTTGTLGTVQESKSQRTNSLPAHNDTEIGYSMHTSKSFHNFPIFHKDSWVFFLQSYQQTCYAGRLVSPSRENCCPRCQDRLLCTAGSRFRPLWADDQHIHHLSRTDSQLHCIRRSFRTGLRWTFRKEKGLLANISFKFQGMQGTNCMLNDLCSVYVKVASLYEKEKKYTQKHGLKKPYCTIYRQEP